MSILFIFTVTPVKDTHDN